VREVTADTAVVEPTRPISFEATEPIVVLGDEQRLRQAVANLLQNALEHTPADTPVEVGVRVDGERAVLTVTDHGPGIPAEHLPRIFERFYRADPSRTRESGGMGLGLAIVASIAEAHGGSARAASEVGVGTTFTFELPLAGRCAEERDGDRAQQEPEEPPS